MELIHKELTEKVIGAAMAVINEVKPGLDEKIYENSMVVELREMGLKVEQQRQFNVFYKQQFVGKLIPDMIVEDKVIVDPKVVTAFGEDHVAQMIGYLNITGLEVALLLNLKFARLQWKRVVRSEFPNPRPSVSTAVNLNSTPKNI